MTVALENKHTTAVSTRFAEWIDRQSGRIMVLPAVLLILTFALFPLIVSAYLALSRFVSGEIDKESTVKAIVDGWNDLTEQIGKEKQLETYKKSLGVER